MKVTIHTEPRKLTPAEKKEYAVEKKNRYKTARAVDYPPIGDQLDAILKGFNALRLDGANLPDELNAVINKWLAVKEKHKKTQ